MDTNSIDNLVAIASELRENIEIGMLAEKLGKDEDDDENI